MTELEEVIESLRNPTRKDRAAVVFGSFLGLWISLNALVAARSYLFSKPSDPWTIRFVEIGLRIMLEEMCVIFCLFCGTLLVWGLFAPKCISRILIMVASHVWTGLLGFAGGMVILAAIVAVFGN